MRETNRNFDKDISTALHHKFDNMPLPNLSPQMMDRVIQRVQSEALPKDENLQRVYMEVQPVAKKHLWMKFSTVGIAASIIVALSTWMMVKNQSADSYGELNVVSRTSITTAHEVPWESTQTISKGTKTLAGATLPGNNELEDTAKTLAQQTTDTKKSQTDEKRANMYAQTKKKVGPKTRNKKSANHHPGSASSHLYMKALPAKLPTTASESSMTDISNFSQETRDMLCARLDMAAQQTADLRESQNWR